jgi:hypothetical protein
MYSKFFFLAAQSLLPSRLIIPSILHYPLPPSRYLPLVVRDKYSSSCFPPPPRRPAKSHARADSFGWAFYSLLAQNVQGANRENRKRSIGKAVE